MKKNKLIMIACFPLALAFRGLLDVFTENDYSKQSLTLIGISMGIGILLIILNSIKIKNHNYK